MKRSLSLALVLFLMLSCLAGCGKKDRILYTEKLSKYVDLGDYEGIKIDTKSDDFKKAYEQTVASDVENNSLYQQKTEGTVAEGDTANIDYVGKKDGVAFDGGTDEGYDLVIGSNSFIEGFEEGLIGVEIGSTVDLNLTFPENYGNEELNGADVVFTVTVNYVTTTDPLTPAEFYQTLGFSSEKEYVKDAEERTTENMLLAELKEKSKIKEYPEKEVEYLYTETKNMYVTNYLEPYGYDFETYLSQYGTTEEDFKKDLVDSNIKPMMDEQMLLYAVLDDAGLSVNNNDVNAKAEEIAKEIGEGVTAEKVKEYYGNYYLEALVVSDKALDYMYKNAKIK